MSREILFKAKRKNWKELPKEEWWIEGLPSQADDYMERFAAAQKELEEEGWSVVNPTLVKGKDIMFQKEDMENNETRE